VTWEDREVFWERYPAFQLADELLIEEGRDVMWGHKYQCHRHMEAAGQPNQSG
jgi:hypothetical protein